MRKVFWRHYLKKKLSYLMTEILPFNKVAIFILKKWYPCGAMSIPSLKGKPIQHTVFCLKEGKDIWFQKIKIMQFDP